MGFQSEIEIPVELEVIQVIKIRFTRGKGTDNDPYRFVDQYWSMDGCMLFEREV